MMIFIRQISTPLTSRTEEDRIPLKLILAANRRRKVQQRRSSTRSNRKLTMAPLVAAIRSMCDLGAQLTARWNQLYVGFWWGRKTENRRKTLEAEKKTNTNSNHLWRRVRESNPGHIGGRRVLSPPRHRCFPRLVKSEAVSKAVKDKQR